MSFNCPDIRTFKEEFETILDIAAKVKTDSHISIKIQSLLNITIYVLAVRFLEGSVKHIVYNCCKIKGFSRGQLQNLSDDLRNFNNPEFQNIKDLFLKHLNYDILVGKDVNKYEDKDITFLNQIVENRHKNVHAPEDSSLWYNANKKDIEDFKKEYVGLINILTFLDSIYWDSSMSSFKP